MTESHEKWMARAIALANKGYPEKARVGCVIVKSGVIVGEGFHKFTGAPHAEAEALAMAGGRSEGSDVYVTLEPCAHHGRTPPCADALIAAKVKRVLFAVPDPNPVARGGAEKLTEAGIEVVCGVGERGAERANWAFLGAMRLQRPVVCVKAAVTIDGYMAREDGTSQWITGAAARRVGHKLRAELGSVLVGWRTVVADDPQLTARIPGVVHQPLRIVLDPELRLTGQETVFRQPGRTLWVVPRGRESGGHHTGVAYDGEFDLGELREILFALGCKGVLVEGGPRTIQSFFDVQMVDVLELFSGPKFFGSGMKFQGPSEPIDLHRPSRVQRLGADVRLTYVLTKGLNIA